VKTIHKAKLSIGQNTISVQIERGACVLFVGVDGRDDLCIWYLANTSSHARDRSVSVYGTGHAMPDLPENYLGSGITRDGYVWHVFSEHLMLQSELTNGNL
jgi:hypothetical protein